MISKVYTLFVLVAGFVLALVLSYYLNIRFDHKAVIVYLKSKWSGRLQARNSVSHSC